MTALPACYPIPCGILSIRETPPLKLGIHASHVHSTTALCEPVSLFDYVFCHRMQKGGGEYRRGTSLGLGVGGTKGGGEGE